ncbi:MAG: RNA-binding S4 domain-containing protein [Inhella sp.]|jgi:ribosome-associated protein|uniref:RNA-binding S4 domain-containing protein n=1 Tax=Inhella sp. TaxID=1921806 RepID=UPI0022C60446|nr:RNA-binding S4 domain-containing protein [Inhella sp.]MCZ8234407.1 RNA-binding S4 domain-containing protein [Inhella sp.]
MSTVPTPFALRGDYITLEALIKASDLAGLGQLARAVIADGAVTVDGEVEQRRGRKLRGGELVRLRGAVVRVEPAGAL